MNVVLEVAGVIVYYPWQTSNEVPPSSAAAWKEFSVGPREQVSERMESAIGTGSRRSRTTFGRR